MVYGYNVLDSILWANSFYANSIFVLQKRVIRIMYGVFSSWFHFRSLFTDYDPTINTYFPVYIPVYYL